ncbi:polyol transporter 5-like [Curcuma longa]|uniref:polyol transporter 5-like n=1 Tax=Curcuma longa TaxID=136217 RepID=UPI003D9F9B99
MGEKKEDGEQLASVEKMAPPPKQGRNMYTMGCTMLASLASILLGYDIGVMSGAQKFIQNELHISDTQVEILLGILDVYALVGSFAAGFTSDRIGRRYTIVLAAAIFFAGALLMGFAMNYAFLMFGRFFAGVGVGYALMISPTYTAEVAPASCRGFLTSFPEVFINVGILLGYISNYAFSHLRQSLGWRFMLGVAAIPAVFLGFGVLAMPESPRWLVMRGRLGDAKEVLEKTCDSPEEARLRLAEIKMAAGIPEECDDDVVAVPKKNRDNEGAWRELLLRPRPSVRRVLIAALGIHFFQQTSGIDSVVLYTPRVFKAAGIKSDDAQLGTTVAVGFTKTLFILVATFFLDRVGRRPLLLGSYAGMIVSLAALGIGLTAVDRHGDGGHQLQWAAALSISSTLAYVAFFSIGAGPIAWVYSSEIFPLRLRAMGAAMGVAMNRVTSGVIAMTFISLYKAITLGGSFFLYAGMAAVGWVFFFTFLPETRGKTLEEMQELFGEEKKTAAPENGKDDTTGVEMVNGGN